MVNPTDNAPVAAGWEIAMRAGDLVTKAMAGAVPEETIAATKGIVCNIAYGGEDPRDDNPYVYYETVAGGYGARASKDGMDAVQTHFQNTANSPIEELETEIPVYVREYGLRENSAGAGRQRGGLGVRRDYEFYGTNGTFSLLTDRTKSAPWGLFGGHSAGPAEFVRDPDGEAIALSSKSTTELEPGELVSVRTPGGGGYGDPIERDPQAVLEDVRNGICSQQRAREVYGVVIDGDVDEAATRDRRREIRDDSEDGDDSEDATAGRKADGATADQVAEDAATDEADGTSPDTGAAQ
jgi:N-methylhydantoinase B